MSKERVAILGASDKPDRYSFKALKMLQDKGHKPFLVSPNYSQIEGLPVAKSLSELENIDTLTVYVNPSISNSLAAEILELAPRRIIFNPGSENYDLMSALKGKGIEMEEACTLVLLSSDQF
jgi:predicted CoA-binding protein